MPPKKKKDSSRKSTIPLKVLRPPISSSSLVWIPPDAVEGYQERIETGIEWTPVNDALRKHKKMFEAGIPLQKFSDALKLKINQSILRGFLDKNSSLSMQDQWTLILTMTLWDIERFGNNEEKRLFKNANSITDNLTKIIEHAVKLNSRKSIKKELKEVSVLRVMDAQLTELDHSLTAYKNVTTLNLCYNFLTSIDATCLPPGLRTLELQANCISDVKELARLPEGLHYLGLARNLLNDESVRDLDKLPQSLNVLDLSDNDIYYLLPVLEATGDLSNLEALFLAGNPCSLCAEYARTTLHKLPRLRWLDCREILPTDRHLEAFEPHPHDLKSTYFLIDILRIMSVPVPPRTEKGTTTSFHVELELPLLDSARRRFLMYFDNSALVETLPSTEEDLQEVTNNDQLRSQHQVPPGSHISKMQVPEAASALSIDDTSIYNNLEPKISREVLHFTVYQSNNVPWSKIMTFQEPTVRIFCPDLKALRDTFRSVITLRLIYTITYGSNKIKEKKSSVSLQKKDSLLRDKQVTLATIRCALQPPDWSQRQQHFHWDSSLGSLDAIHWGDGDLSILQYGERSPRSKTDNVPSATKSMKGKHDGASSVKPTKGRSELKLNQTPYKQQQPEHLTCHFGFGIETCREPTDRNHVIK